MAATKTCPECHAEVPAAAPRCKHCFHDFSEAPRKRSGGLVALVAFIALAAALSAGTMYYLQANAAKEHNLFDRETRSIVFTKQYRDRTETNRVSFDEVAKVELLIGDPRAAWVVEIVTVDGKRYVYNKSDDKNLQGMAEYLANAMEKPLVVTRVRKSFMDTPASTSN